MNPRATGTVQRLLLLGSFGTVAPEADSAAHEVPMSRSTSVAILAAIPCMPLSSPAGNEPPSSLDEARGTVTFVHVAERVVACTPKKSQGLLTCEPERQPVDASTEIALSPVQQGVSRKDNRKPVSVSLPKDGTQGARVELGIGLWDLDWSAKSRQARFALGEREELGIRLTTTLGACQLVKDECSLKTDVSRVELTVPRHARR